MSAHSRQRTDHPIYPLNENQLLSISLSRKGKHAQRAGRGGAGRGGAGRAERERCKHEWFAGEFVFVFVPGTPKETHIPVSIQPTSIFSDSPCVAAAPPPPPAVQGPVASIS